ncbi:MAG TPA: Lpg1974 family pore-forming outer membrane protein [Alphaproteobacteria bacterium]
MAPEDGWGGRLWADLLFGPNLMVRGTLNGAWLEDDESFDGLSGSLVTEQRAEIDAWWATLEGFYLWHFGRPARPHTMIGLGGGIEYADVENSFEEQTAFIGRTTASTLQESTFWGIGPRIAGILDHELGQSGVHFFAEAGVAYLFGDRDDDLQQQVFTTANHLTANDGGNVWHFGTRLGVGYVVPMGTTNFRIDVGWRHDIFNQSNNVLYLPENRGGDTSFGGPFLAASVDLPL